MAKSDHLKTRIKRVMKVFKPFDFVVIIVLIIGSFLPCLFFFLQEAQAVDNEGDRIAIVRINGELVDEFNLDEVDDFEKTYYPADDQYNIVQVEDGRIRVKQDNSPDQIAVKTSWIWKNGQTSICLPHRLVIEITQENAEPEYDVY
ncbi:MAG: NusG domain II-containing protein [Bavariicoccus seileri]|uniref:NusG domain II-containing protein n=1 Tax=Bavariicoccus seileri TaxID=549685 RepID=UPI003F8EF05F